MAISILLIEDEIDMQDILKELLQSAGYLVDVASDGLEGINHFKSGQYDLVLLDLMIPKIDGFTVCEMIRQESNIPVVMLTAMDDEENQIKGFSLKADDYITKPFSIKLVLMRIEAVLRRISCESSKDLVYKDLKLNTENYQVHVCNKQVKLTRREFELLELFMKNQGRVFTRENILNQIWGYDFYGREKAVDLHIMNIRKKLGVDYIKTIRGVGYLIDK